MDDEKVAAALRIDVSESLPAVGDSRCFRGNARVVFDDQHQLAFLEGEGVSWSVVLRRIAGGVEVNIVVSGVVVLSCFRCLNEYEFPFSVKSREHALWVSEGHLEPGDGFDEEYQITDGFFDLMAVLRDAIYLSFPAMRVCREDCRGLCSTCGADLNLGDCGCDRQRFDERLKPLEELKKRLEVKGKGGGSAPA